MAILKQCAHCQQCFRAAQNSKRYCSQRCYDDARRPAPRTCPQCKIVWQPGKGYVSTQDFCSKPCWYKWHRGSNHAQSKRVPVPCDWCGSEVYRIPYRLQIYKHQYCSRVCSAKAHSLKMRGMSEGKPQQAKFYALTEWRTIRAMALARDNYRCTICGITDTEHKARHKGCGLHVDHIEPRRINSLDDLSNLQTLCAAHHSQKTNQGK